MIVFVVASLRFGELLHCMPHVGLVQRSNIVCLYVSNSDFYTEKNIIGDTVVVLLKRALLTTAVVTREIKLF